MGFAIMYPILAGQESALFHVILYQPEIPPNTGNVIRMCANSGAHLHLIQPLGFDIDEKSVRRSGMDYAELADVRTWESLEQCLKGLEAPRWFAVSTRGTFAMMCRSLRRAMSSCLDPRREDYPQEVLESCPADRSLRIAMRPGNRSLNLSNAVAVVVYEAWRQRGFHGAG